MILWINCQEEKCEYVSITKRAYLTIDVNIVNDKHFNIGQMATLISHLLRRTRTFGTLDRRSAKISLNLKNNRINSYNLYRHC